MRGLGISLLIVAAFVIVLWLIGGAFGFQLALMPSLVASLGLTVLLNFLVRAFRGR